MVAQASLRKRLSFARLINLEKNNDRNPSISPYQVTRGFNRRSSQFLAQPGRCPDCWWRTYGFVGTWIVKFDGFSSFSVGHFMGIPWHTSFWDSPGPIYENIRDFSRNWFEVNTFCPKLWNTLKSNGFLWVSPFFQRNHCHWHQVEIAGTEDIGSLFDTFRAILVVNFLTGSSCWCF